MDGKSERDENLREMACVGHMDEVIKLIKSGADVNSQNKVNGWTCLHWAAKRSHPGVIRGLLEHGANPNIESIKGDTAYELSKSIDIIKEFQSCQTIDNQRYLKAISHLTTKNNSGNTLIEFIPNYLKNPVFPHWSGDGDDPNLAETGSASKHIVSKSIQASSTTKQVNVNQETADEDDIILKIRVCSEEDFIEVDANPKNCSLNELIDIFCTELNINNDNVKYVRKLPNTKLRNDKDLKRLLNLQELELVLT